MKRTPKSPVQIGVGPARIVQVTPMQLDYIDGTGQKQSINLKACAQNWEKYIDDSRRQAEAQKRPLSESARAWNARCVGARDLLDAPPWVVFMDEQRTRFTFTSLAESYEQLLNPLGLVGWHTWDAG